MLHEVLWIIIHWFSNLLMKMSWLCVPNALRGTPEKAAPSSHELCCAANDEGMEARKVFPNLRSVLKVRGLRSPRSQRAVAEAQRPSQEFTPHQVAQPARTFLHPLKGKEDWKLSRAATVQAREENNV